MHKHPGNIDLGLGNNYSESTTKWVLINTIIEQATKMNCVCKLSGILYIKQDRNIILVR